MSDMLQNILEKYKIRTMRSDGDEQRFADLHTDNISVFDGPGVKEVMAAANATSRVAKPEAPNDEEMYESVSFTIDEIKAALADPSLELNQDLIESIEDELFNVVDLDEEAVEYLSIIDEAVNDFYQEATEEEQAIIDEMLSTDEGYEEFLDMIFEDDMPGDCVKCKKCDGDGCSHCEGKGYHKKDEEDDD